MMHAVEVKLVIIGVKKAFGFRLNLLKVLLKQFPKRAANECEKKKGGSSGSCDLGAKLRAADLTLWVGRKAFIYR